MILPVSQALAVPKVVGNGFSENMTIGQSEDTLGSVRDKANAAMPKEGGTFTGGIKAQSVTASEFDADSDTILLKDKDLTPVAKLSLEKISLFGDKLSLYPSDPARIFLLSLWTQIRISLRPKTCVLLIFMWALLSQRAKA